MAKPIEADNRAYHNYVAIFDRKLICVGQAARLLLIADVLLALLRKFGYVLF